MSPFAQTWYLTSEDISERGRYLYDYDVACWIASDSMMAQIPDVHQLGMYLAKRSQAGWVVGFGQLSGDGGAFLLAYEVESNPSKTHFCTVNHFSPVVPDTGFYLKAGKAVDLSEREFIPPYRYQYTVIVAPEPDGTWSVYHVPAVVSKDTIPIGGDAKFVVSHDGSEVVQNIRLHKSLLLMPTPPDSAQAVALSHVHVLNDYSVETDVFYMLRQRPRTDHYIGTTNERHFKIITEGSIYELHEK